MESDSLWINSVLIFDPTLKPSTRKPLQQQLQTAKIIAHYPISLPSQELCNRVGMIQGTCLFCSALGQDSNYCIVRGINNLYISKLIQRSVWLFVQVVHRSCQTISMGEQYLNQQIFSYVEQTITDQQALQLANNLGLVLRVFGGSISKFIQKKSQLTQILAQIVPKFMVYNLNKLNKWTNETLMLNAVRLIPFQPTQALRLFMLQQILRQIDSDLVATICFSGNYLCYTSLSPEATMFFSWYFMGTGQGLKFDELKLERLYKVKTIEGQKYASRNSFGYYVRLNEINDENEVEFPLTDLQPFGSQSSCMMCFVGGGFIYVIFSKSQNCKKKSKVIQQINKYLTQNLQRVSTQVKQSMYSLEIQDQAHQYIYINQLNKHGKRALSTIPPFFSKIKACKKIIIQEGKELWVYRQSLGRWYLIKMPGKQERPKQALSNFQRMAFGQAFI